MDLYVACKIPRIRTRRARVCVWSVSKREMAAHLCKSAQNSSISMDTTTHTAFSGTHLIMIIHATIPYTGFRSAKADYVWSSTDSKILIFVVTG